MYKTTDCAHCNDLDTFFNDSKDKLTAPLEYSSFAEGTNEFTEFGKTNDLSGTPVSRICTVNKEGKEDCSTFVGVDDAKNHINKFLKTT